MKKLFVLIISIAMLFCSCNSNLPNGITQAVLDYGTKSVNIVDQYFAGTISRTDAQKQIDELCSAYNSDKATVKSEINISPSMEVIASYLLLEQGEDNVISVKRTILDERNDIAKYLELEQLEDFPEDVQN